MIYVLSDIHGNMRRFDSILKQIELTEEDTLYILGDVIDRHHGGIDILLRIMAMDNVKMILGNHEYMMLRAIGHPYDDNWSDGYAMQHWYSNGGEPTHFAFQQLNEILQKKIVEYLKSLPLSVDVVVLDKRYKLVHGAPQEEYKNDSKYINATHYAVWKRIEQNGVSNREYTLVFGHTPTRHYQANYPMEVWYGQNCIGIDCGCAYPEAIASFCLGRLSCLRLDDGFVYYSDENE